MARGATRREFTIAVAAAALVGYGFRATPAETKTLRLIAQADLRVLDPLWTTAYITRNHGYMVFDTPFACDAEFSPHPQRGQSDRTPNRPAKLTPQKAERSGPGHPKEVPTPILLSYRHGHADLV